MEGTVYRPQSWDLQQPGIEVISRSSWVIFTLDSGRYALQLDAVERIVRAAQITALPHAPDVVLGAINIQGQVLPVFSLRRRFNLPDRMIGPDDGFLIAQTGKRRVALVIDAALGVVEHPSDAVVDAKHINGSLEHIQGVIPLKDGMVLIHDLEQLLSPDEARLLDAAMLEEESLAP